MNIATWPRRAARSSSSSKWSITKNGCTRPWATARRPSLNALFPCLKSRNSWKDSRTLAMRFLRHDGIYRSDVSSLLFTPGACPASRSGRCQGIGQAGKNMPCPSSAMSSGRLFLDRVGRHQSPSPLHRHPQLKALAFRHPTDYHRTAGLARKCLNRLCQPRGQAHVTPPLLHFRCSLATCR